MSEGRVDLNKSAAPDNTPSTSNRHDDGVLTTAHPTEQGEDARDQGKTSPSKIPFFKFNIPNTLTFLRFLAIYPLAHLIAQWPERRLTAFFLYAAIWVTDFLDGWIARNYHMVTQFGKLFDPFVDKVFQVVTVYMFYTVGRVPRWVPIFYACKELAMVIGGFFLLTRSNVVVYADIFGKLSTVLFIVSSSLVILYPEPLGIWSEILFILPAVTSIIAMAHYAIKNIFDRKKDPGA